MQVDCCRQQVHDGDDHQRGLVRCVDAGIDKREIYREQHGGNFRADQHAPHHGAENDGGDRQSFYPAVGDNQLLRWQHFGEDAVFCRRIRCGAQADDCVGEEHGEMLRNPGGSDFLGEKEQATADNFDRIRKEHDAPFRERVGEGADERSEDDIRHSEEELEQGRHPRRAFEFYQQGN